MTKSPPRLRERALRFVQGERPFLGAASHRAHAACEAEIERGQAENDEPQPQVPFTFGLLNLNPEP